MAGTLVAVFENHNQASAAAKALLEAKVPFGDISLVRQGARGELGGTLMDEGHPDDDEEEFVSHGFREVATHDIEQAFDPRAERAPRIVTGVVAGMPLGALAVATAVMIPGIGPLIAAEPLAAMLTGTLAGGVISGLVGALTADGIPVEAAGFYHEQVSAGNTLIAVLVGRHEIDKLDAIISRNGGHDIRYFARFIDSLQSVES
jgi:hypothetical protein